MPTHTEMKGFTLVEILMFICIVVIVSAIALPIYWSLQTQAEQTVSTATQSELNNVYANWKASGGTVKSGATTADILRVLTSNTPVNIGVVQDSVVSSSIRLANSSGLLDALKGAATDGSVVVFNGTHIYYYASDPFASGSSNMVDQFYVASARTVNTPYDGSAITMAQYPLLLSSWFSHKGDPKYIAMVDYDKNGVINEDDYDYFCENVTDAPTDF